MCVEKRKSGSWKRRAKMQQMSEVKENETANEYCKKNMGSKRVFMLRAEEDMQEENDKNGKKAKIRGEEMNVCDNLVKVANHNWPQPDQ